MRRWLTRFLNPTKPKKPPRPEARGFSAQHIPLPFMDVLSRTADVITELFREPGRQHRQDLENAPPPPSATNVVALPASLPEKGVDTRIRALCEAASPNERRRVAARYPALRPPHRCLSKKENLVLEWTYWDGLHDTEIKEKLGRAFVPHIIRNEALRKLARHLASERQAVQNSKRQPVQEAPKRILEPAYNTPPERDARLTELILASTARQRQEAAFKHPKLRPPHDALNLRENDLLELTFWQGLTYKEAGQRFTFSAGRASPVANKALRKLGVHMQRGGSLGKAPPGFLERLDELRCARSVSGRKAVAARYHELRPPHTLLQPRENDVLERFYWQGQPFDTIAEHHGLTRQQTSKVRDDALKKLEVHYPHAQAQDRTAPAEAKEVAPQAVVLGEDARITAFRRAGPTEKRREVAGRYPELRPPHKCLSETENDLLELVFWQGQTFAEVAALRGLPRKEIGTRVRRALEQLNRHLYGDAQQDEDRLGEVLLALNECGSVKRAAKKLEVGKDVLKAFVAREGISARTVFEVDEQR